jgi:hypothetical protein
MRQLICPVTTIFSALPVECVDVWPTRRCEKKLGQGKCGNRKVAKNCEKTCGTCSKYQRH